MLGKTRRFVGIIGLSLAVYAAAAPTAFSADDTSVFAPPQADAVAVWEAEKAPGAWQKMEDPRAGGGAYAVSAGEDRELVFEFTLAEKSRLQFWPRWWIHGEQKTAVKFPRNVEYFKVQQVWPMAYPDLASTDMTRPNRMNSRTGPDTIDYVGGRAFFNAPESGKVGVVNIGDEKIEGVVETGGYPAEVLCDREAKKVFVTDMANDLLLVLNSDTLAIEKKIPLAPEPRSMAALAGRLYVISMKGRVLTVLNLADQSVVKTIPLPHVPQHVDVLNGKLVVWFLPVTLNPENGKESPPNRLSYASPSSNGGLMPKSLLTENYYVVSSKTDEPAFLFAGKEKPGDRKKTFVSYEDAAGKRLPKEEKIEMDFSAILSAPPTRNDYAYPLVMDPRPKRAVAIGRRLFMNGGPSGKVWVLDAQTKEIKSVNLGGYISDVQSYTAMLRGCIIDVCNDHAYGLMKYDCHFPTREATGKPKIYAADAANNKLYVIDPESLAVLKNIDVPAMPLRMSFFGVDLHVACYEGRSVVILDMTTDTVRHVLKVPGRPRAVDGGRLQPPCTSTEFRTAVLDDSPLRVIADLEPMAIDPASLAEVKPLETKPLYLPRVELDWTAAAAGKKKNLFVDNNHTIRFDKTRWLDTLDITDPQSQPALGTLQPRDTAGTISISIDDKGANDWSKNVWMAPRTRLALANGTDEFRRYNANAFTLEPGIHKLRIKAHSPYAMLDAIEVRRLLPEGFKLELLPEPRAAHSKVQLPAYMAVFAYNEEPAFAAVAASPESVDAKVKVILTDSFGEAVETRDLQFNGIASQPRQLPLKFDRKEPGIYRVRLEVASPKGFETVETYFAKFPKFSHPFLFFRREDYPSINRFIQSNSALFKRYNAYLKAACQKEGFLPAQLAGAGQNTLNDNRRWRAVACQFAQTFLEEKGSTFYTDLNKARMQPHGMGVAFAGDFEFWGAQAVVLDIMAASGNPDLVKFKSEMVQELGMRPVANLPESLLNITEPFKPSMRAALCELTRTRVNQENYWLSHMGTRGGNLWQDVRAMCQCQMHSTARNYLYFRNIFGDRRLLETPLFRGWMLHACYTEPPHPRDNPDFYPPTGIRGYPLGEGFGGQPERWAFSLLAREPIDITRMAMGDWIETMTKKVSQLSDAEFEKYLAEPGMDVIPMFLALGWADPSAPKATWAEMPPTVLFDAEGEVVMKAGRGANQTDLYFSCGVRDISYHQLADDLRIVRNGDILWGTNSRAGDHGTPVPAWANAVQIGTRWRTERGRIGGWDTGGGPYPRMEERWVMNRFSPAMAGYSLHAYRMSGLLPIDYGYGFSGGHGGPGTFDMIMHSHTHHPYYEQGKIRAFETRPEFDYVCGDATNSWPLAEVKELYRQLVFIKPDLVVIYDRGELASADVPQTWTAAPAAKTEVKDNTFTIRGKGAALTGTFLLPEKAKVVLVGDIEAAAPAPTSHVEYLVCMNLFTGQPAAVETARVLTENEAGCIVKTAGGSWQVRFARKGAPAGSVTLVRGQSKTDFPLTDRVNDTYAHWKNDPRFNMWMTDDRFNLVVSAQDRKNFGGK